MIFAMSLNVFAHMQHIVELSQSKEKCTTILIAQNLFAYLTNVVQLTLTKRLRSVTQVNGKTLPK